MNLDTLGSRLIWARTQQGWDQAKLIESSGVPQGTVSKIERGAQDTTGKYAAKLARALNVSQDWLTTGEGDSQIQEQAPRYEANTSAAEAPSGKIPLISKVQAGGWEDAIDSLQPGEAESYHEATKNHGPKTYALRVEGDSMWSGQPSGPSYHDGDIIIVDPDQSGDAINGSRVIALLLDDNLSIDRRVTFKQLVLDGPHNYLRPLNKSYDAIREPFEVIGLVLHSIRPD